ncbi:hypothetical protein R3P38DRAFT_2543195 [Favolaschia claudopus]|uniref:Uncharacterized protein n=1 Tax=Favolaschia claudopus TaxID=2862362 RepID=A0AAW0AT74_9AGAR
MANKETLLKLWTPRLHPYEDDALLFAQEPFATVFARFKQKPNVTRHGNTRWSDLKEALTEACPQFVPDWLRYTIGAEIVERMPGEAIDRGAELWADVLYTRYIHGNTTAGSDAALQLVLKAQLDNFKQYWKSLPAPPANFALTEEIGVRDCEADVSDSDSSSDGEYNPVNDEDFMDLDDGDSEDMSVDNDDSSYETDSDSSDETDAPQFVDHTEAPRPYTFRKVCNADTEPLADRVKRWVTNMKDFFNGPYDEEQARNSYQVVDDMVQMRALKSTTYKSAEFLRMLEASDNTMIRELKDSGLFSLLQEVARPGNLLETTHPDITKSFRYYNWKVSYGALIVKWVEPCLSQEEFDNMRPPLLKNFRFTSEQASDLLRFISNNPRIHPWGFNRMAAFMFSSEGAFTYHWETWLMPGLQELNYDSALDRWDVSIVFRAIKRLPCFRETDKTLHPQLAAVIGLTSERRYLQDKIKRELYRPKETGTPLVIPMERPASPTKPTMSRKRRENANTRRAAAAAPTPPPSDAVPSTDIPNLDPSQPNSCPHCRDRPMEEKCIRVVEVTRREVSNLLNSALTCAPEGDRMAPKPPTNGGKSKPMSPIQYFHPFDDLKMMLVEHREDVYARCGQDIVRFVEKGTTIIVGGVRFEVFSAETLAILLDNHRLVEIVAIERREEIDRWNPGTMTGPGTRQPAGGYKGDGYGAYPSHQGRTPQEIKAVSRQGISCDALVEAGNTIDPGLKKRLTDLTAKSSIEYLGQTGLTLYDCTNYASPVHVDTDMGLEDVIEGRSRKDGLGDLSPCVQLEKSGCGKDDYNFAYALLEVRFERSDVRWGVVVRTQANTVWWVLFNGREEHASVLPAASVMRNATSNGGHPTTSGTNVVRAQRVREIRCGYDLRTRVVHPRNVRR